MLANISNNFVQSIQIQIEYLYQQTLQQKGLNIKKVIKEVKVTRIVSQRDNNTNIYKGGISYSKEGDSNNFGTNGGSKNN